jgi:hypothetical protein
MPDIQRYSRTGKRKSNAFCSARADILGVTPLTLQRMYAHNSSLHIHVVSRTAISSVPYSSSGIILLSASKAVTAKHTEH